MFSPAEGDRPGKKAGEKHRIDMGPVENGPVMENRSGHATCVSDMADHLAPEDTLPRADLDVRHVKIFREESSSMVQNHHVSVIVKRTGQPHHTVIGRPDRRSLGNVDVLSGMAGHRMSVQEPIGPKIVGHLSFKGSHEGPVEAQGGIGRGEGQGDRPAFPSEAGKERGRGGYEGAGHSEPGDLKGAGRHPKKVLLDSSVGAVKIQAKPARGTGKVDSQQGRHETPGLSGFFFLLPGKKRNPPAIEGEGPDRGLLRKKQENEPSLGKGKASFPLPGRRPRHRRQRKKNQDRDEKKPRKGPKSSTHGSTPVSG